MKPCPVLLPLLALVCCTHVAAAQQTDTLALPKDEEEIVAWLRQNAIPLRHVEAGNGFADLQPLKQILKDVKVVGLGEATHGTREFFQIKHRLLEFLVTEMGFNAFAMEAGFAACQPINNYVLYGKGDLATVLTDQGFVVWDTEELTEMLKWLRQYNEGVPDEKKVRFYGLDLIWSELGADEVLAYVEKGDPGKVAATDSLFQALARGEDKEKALRQLQDLTNYLSENRGKFINNSSLAEFDNTLQYINVMKQQLLMEDNSARSKYMFENLEYVVEHERPDAKFVVWAHNVHVGKGTESHSPGGSSPGPYMGYYLKEKYGNQYYAAGFEFSQGSYQSRVSPPGEAWADLKAGILPAAAKGSLAWYLSHAKLGQMILDLRNTPMNMVVERWLDSPQVVHHIGWAYQEPSEVYSKVSIKEQYDGVVFIERTTATRPTVNALKTVSNRKGI
jgi:erythromycin esterase